MDYNKIYLQLINRSQTAKRQKSCNVYFESHHIIPLCLGGTDNQENLVLLTAKEHYIAHKLLCRIYPDNKKLFYALWAMMNLNNKNQKRTYSISSREYQYARIQYIELMKQPKTIEHKLKLKDSWTIERKLAESKRKLGKPVNYKNGINPNKGRKKPLKSVRLGKLHHMWGNQHSIETKTKISNTLTGHIVSEETKKKMKISAKNRPIIKCPYCDIQSRTAGNMSRYHFDNCKYKGINNA
jgi:hypothetical protein